MCVRAINGFGEWKLVDCVGVDEANAREASNVADFIIGDVEGEREGPLRTHRSIATQLYIG